MCKLQSVSEQSEDDCSYVAEKQYQDSDERQTIDHVADCRPAATASTSVRRSGWQICSVGGRQVSRRRPDIVVTTSLTQPAVVPSHREHVVVVLAVCHFPAQSTVPLLTSRCSRQVGARCARRRLVRRRLYNNQLCTRNSVP